MSGTSWLLGDGYSWRSAAGAPGAVVANDVAGMTLATLPDGAFGLASADGSLGRLVMPRGVVLDGDRLLVLSADGSRVFEYDALDQALKPIAEMGAVGIAAGDEERLAEPRRFRAASGIAFYRGILYVADPQAQRVQVFELATRVLLRIHEGLLGPVDIAAGRDGVYVADAVRGCVFRARPELDWLETVVDVSSADPALPDPRARAQHWYRIAIDAEERIYLGSRQDGGVVLDMFAAPGGQPATQPIERFTDSAQLRDRFGSPSIVTDDRGVLVVPPQLLDPCGILKPLPAGTPRWSVGARLYAMDLATNALLVYLPDGRIRHRFAPRDASGLATGPTSTDAWRIGDVIAWCGGALILDARHQIVYSHPAGASGLTRSFAAAAGASSDWRRLATDEAGDLLLWDGASASVARYDARGTALGTVSLDKVRHRFAPASTRERRPQRPAPELAREGSRPRLVPARVTWPKPLYASHGVWTSEWLDSEIYDCAWDAITLTIAQLPPGTSIALRARTCNSDPDDPVAMLLAGSGAPSVWQAWPTLNAAPQPDPSAPAGMQPDYLVQSPPGRFLQLEVTLGGDGAGTPLLMSARLDFPRDSLLDNLPAIYSAPPEQRTFLDRFLALVQTTWSAGERQLTEFRRYLDPRSVPPEAMDYLASWLGIALEQSWTADQKRILLRALPDLRRTWGTIAGLRAWVRVYLAALADRPVADLEASGVPGIVESFVDRRHVLLAPEAGPVQAAGTLWSSSVERRFQIGVYDQLGSAAIVSPGDPTVDVFRHYAFAFRVYVPAAFVQTAEAEAQLRRAIELQKPAHTTYELVLVEPRLRVGDQSTIDLDTVIGEPECEALGCADDDDAPSLPPRHRLGFDATLGGRSGRVAPAVDRGLN